MASALVIGAIVATVGHRAAADDPAPPLVPPGLGAPGGIGPLPGEPKPSAEDRKDTGKTRGDRAATLYKLSDDARPDRIAPPASHTRDWLKRHGPIARATADGCTSACHTQPECIDCHTGPLKPVDIHPAGYIALHAPESRRNPAACATCHTAQHFCRDCHTRVRAAPSGVAKPPPGVRYHPASWLGQTAGPNHARQARLDLMSCASCHQERDCVRCHTGINPHPPGFAATCSALMRRNATPCLSCHTASDPTLQRCR